MKIYRFIYRPDGWHTQIRRLGLWWRVNSVGPFGYSAANPDIQWAKDCLAAMIMHRGRKLAEQLRPARMLAKAMKANCCPVPFRDLPSNAETSRPAVTDTETTNQQGAGSAASPLLGDLEES